MLTQTFKPNLIALSVIAGMLSSTSVSAKTEQTQDIETISVLGKTYRNTATKTSLEPEETPQAINVIDSEDLEAHGVKTLNQALRYTPGVVAEQRGGSVSMYDTFRIRGFDVSTNYYDGLSLPASYGFLQPQIDPIAVQQVEVFKGPTSVLYGSMAPGGMVNMIAKSPQTESSTDVGVATGSRNLMEASIDSTGQIGTSDFSYRFIGLARKQDSQVDSIEEERYVIAPSVDWQVSDNTLINFNLYYQNDPSLGLDSSLPAVGMFIDSPQGSTSPSTFVGADDWSKFEREVLMVGYKINHDFGNGWNFLQNARYIDASTYREDTYYTQVDTMTGDLNDMTAYSIDQDHKGFFIDNQLSKTFMTGDVEHNALFGFDYQRQKGSMLDTTYYDKTYVVNIFNPNNDYIDRNNLGTGTEFDNSIELEQIGVYLQDQIRINNLVLIAGGRYDNYTSDETSYGTDFEADHSNFSYRVGGLYELGNGFSPYLSYATSFEPAAGTDSSGNSFDPQIGKQFEVGLKYLSMDMSKQFTMSYFHIIKEDSLLPDANNYPFKIQVGEIVSQGVEFEGTWYATDSLDITTAYAYTDAEVTEDVNPDLVGTTPIYVPTHAASVWANYFFYDGALSGTRASAGVRYMGEMEVNAENTQGKVPDYIVADLSFGYDLSYLSESMTDATANLVVTNLFDEDTYTCYDINNCWYGAERTVELNFNYNF
ncbi:ligand-gated channel protein [Vibrio inusitatus NBRC 102082]|uniref:Ligand-gated channel protein n=1 Tax=Vibrio inusitatus NBRC 102082 TaxID=1219070 RepID=A0A4Y3HXT7_9VIBR|nr:TonB-dependent siderophore receptor [Vibrio inusitatus]GEA51993.1 ligand-gated channel protein [Vibrio inusitatus NBRC 102082]